MSGTIDEVIARMQRLLEPLAASKDPRQYFHATYLRTTLAVAAEIKRGGFIDAEWTERWDVAFARFYLDALEATIDGGQPARPWAIAFGAPADMPALNHVLFGMNAHINFDLPQALLAVITDEEFDEPAVIARREADHRHVDRVLASRVAGEGDVLAGISGPGSRLNRLLRPLNELGTRRFLRESRQKVWANAVVLSHARRSGHATYDSAVAQLSDLSAAKVAALQDTGQVVLKLAVTGFGVRLPTTSRTLTSHY
ncbi:MAG: DUF5995 family protein [Streptosporangiaceae bacterium]